MAVLEGVLAADGAKRPIAAAHSVWEIVNHIAAWNRIVERRLRDETVKVTAEMDWPMVPIASDVTWKRRWTTCARAARCCEKPRKG